MVPKLSICIPTFNRADYLDNALVSIAKNIEGQDIVEVVVSDNHSLDHTESVVISYQKEFPLLYHKNIRNVGAEKNYRIAANLARGEYIWFFCDDDMMVNAAFTYLLNFIMENRDIEYIYYPRILADKNLIPKKNGIQPIGLDGNRIFDSGYELLKAYDNQLTSLIGFLGSNIIRQKSFIGAMDSMNQRQFYQQWTFLRIIFKAISNQRCAVLGKPGIICRLNNSRCFTKINSETWFDDYIALYQFAKEIGYYEDSCNMAIKGIINAFSKSFVIDKANGDRTDNISIVLARLGVRSLKLRKQPWYLLSFLPSRILNIGVTIVRFVRGLTKWK